MSEALFFFTWISVQLPEHGVNTVVKEIWQDVTAASNEAFDHTPQLFSCKAVWVIWREERGRKVGTNKISDKLIEAQSNVIFVVVFSMFYRECSCWVWSPSLVQSAWGWGILPDLWPRLMGFLGTGSDCGPTAALGRQYPAKKGNNRDEAVCSEKQLLHYVREKVASACDRFEDATMLHCVCPRGVKKKLLITLK